MPASQVHCLPSHHHLHDFFPASFDFAVFTTDSDPPPARDDLESPSPFNARLHEAVIPPTTIRETVQLGAPQLPFGTVEEADAMGSLSDAVFDDALPPDHFTMSEAQSASPIPERRDSVTSITGNNSGGMDNHDGHRGGSLEEGSDDGSDESNGHINGVNLLDDPMSDDFGLLSRGPEDGTDMGGKLKDEQGAVPPAWSELKTKAGKERKRLPLACIACRRKKIRCSGEKPACKHCLRSRVPCVYKVTARKAAPRTDYMAMLDKRLKRMEERIIKIVPKAEQDSAVVAVTRAAVKPTIPAAPAGSKSASSKKRTADDAFGPDLEHWARAPSKAAPEGASRPTPLKAQEAEEGKLLLEGSDALPSKEIQEHLAEVFFDSVYGQAYHVLHKPSYMRKLKAGTLPPVLVLCVCAVSARFSTHPKLASSPNFLRGEEWASHARDIVTKRYEWPNITILTCLLILGLHEFGTCHGGRSWAFGGQAIRMAFALQLHKDLEYDPLARGGKEAAQLSFIDREIRRRTMWACFLMDRFNSSGTDRPTFIREETIKTPLPIKEKYFQLDMPGPTEMLEGPSLEPVTGEDSEAADARDNMGVAAYMIRAIAIWGRVINYLNQGGKEADPHPMWSPDSEYSMLIKQTDDIAANLPDSLAYSLDNLHQHETENQANQFVFLHIAIQQNILFMNRFAVSSPNGHFLKDVPKPFVTKAGAKAFAAANRMSELLRESEKHLISAPFVGYCAFLSSTVHIFGVFSGNPAIESNSKKNLATNVKFLAKMKRYWGMFHWMSENLREQYRTCADSARQGTPASESSAPPIFQYGDWFDRYPHGVSQTDFMDPASYKQKEKGDDAVLEQKPELHTVEEFITTLSPQSSDGPNAAAAAAKQPAPAKRKSVSKKNIPTSRNGHQHLERLQTDFGTGVKTPEQGSRSVQMQQRNLQGSLGQTPNTAGYNNALAMSQSQAAASYHNLSPVSPAAMTPFGHPHAAHAAAQAQAQAQAQAHAHAHTPQPYFPADPFSMHLAYHSNPMGLSQLDRQLVFNAYGGMDPGAHTARMNSVAGWPVDGSGLPAGRGVAEARRSAAAAAAAAAAVQGQHGGGGGPASAADSLSAVFGGEASSAWFMPFNMEPPEIGHDLSLGGPGGGLDGFSGMFAGTGGMGTPTNGVLGGGMHRGQGRNG